MSNESENNPARRVDDKRADVPLNWSETTKAPAAAPTLAIPTDVMIDIETLGTTPGSAILSIGAVVFGLDGLGDTFYAPILLQSCTAAGLTIDPNTVAWWMNQSDEARAAAFCTDADALAEVLEQFTCWYGLVGAERPWCHGATFDVPLLDAAYNACGMRAPWRFYDVRDTRTLYDLAHVKVNRMAGTHHNALDDATAQAEAAVKALNIISARQALAVSPASAAEQPLYDDNGEPWNEAAEREVAAEKPTGDLTDEQIEAMFMPMMPWLPSKHALQQFARAIERAAIAAHLARQPKAEQPLWDDNGEPWNEAAEKADRAAYLARQPQQADPQVVTVPRATLEMIYEAMNHMGDILNGMDACEDEDEEATSSAFDAIRGLLDDSYRPAPASQEGAHAALEEVRNRAQVDEVMAAINHACGKLPVGYEVILEMESGAGGVVWIDDEGERHVIDGDGYISQDIHEAVELAIEHAAPKAPASAERSGDHE